MNIAIIGLGLIGGSLAKAFSEYTEHRVIGFDRDPSVVQRALLVQAIDEMGDAPSLSQADVIYLCVYPEAAIQFVKQYARYIRPGCLVTDTCGIKTMVCGELTRLSRQYGFAFAGSHPMAGKERNGWDASEASLFNGASYIIVPCEASKLHVDTLKQLALEIGFGNICITSAEEHDRMIAFTSQVPHALACAYVMSPQCPNHQGFSAGSYRDVSRVAHINEVLWAELFLENREPLVEELNELIRHLDGIKNTIENNDREALQALLRCGRQIKEALGE